jgi:hypothetical protein
VKGDWVWDRARVGRGYIPLIKAGTPIGDSCIGVVEYTSFRRVKRRHVVDPEPMPFGSRRTLCLRIYTEPGAEPNLLPRWERVPAFRPNRDCTLCSRKLVARVNFERRGRLPHPSFVGRGRAPWNKPKGVTP